MENHCFASLDTLKKRAEIIQQIREYFINDGVLELETPILAPAASVDVHLDSFETSFVQHKSKTPLYMQTSPEFHMKRFLSKYSHDCFQITKAFRNGEMGKRHNAEFSILEWYRVGMSYVELMEDVANVVRLACKRSDFSSHSYAEIFKTYLGVDIHSISLISLQDVCLHHVTDYQIESLDEGFDLLLTHVLEPKLAERGCVFVYDYPASQAALAKLSPKDTRLACRFELYIDGVEICNGFEELANAEEQEMRFEHDCKIREKMNKPNYPFDRKLIGALQSGFPACSGVAIGLDRLIMAALGKKELNEVMAFTLENA